MPIFQAKNAWKWGEKLTKDNKIVMKSRIDTIQTREPLTNRGVLQAIVKGHEDVRIDKNGNVIAKWNPNILRDFYSMDYKLSVTKRSMEELFNLVTVINRDEIKMNRIDIATDINMNFDENVKLLDFLHKCLICNFKDGKVWSTIDDEDWETSNIRFTSKDFNVEFYDKKKQSQNKHLYDTRLEVRALRIKSQDYDFHINKTIDLYNACSNNIERVEKIVVEKLIKRWHKRKAKEPNLKLTMFVHENINRFYTMNILRAVYKEAGLTGSLKNWVQKYRKNYEMNLYTKTDIEKFTKEIVKSLKLYKKL